MKKYESIFSWKYDNFYLIHVIYMQVIDETQWHMYMYYLVMHILHVYSIRYICAIDGNNKHINAALINILSNHNDRQYQIG